MPSLRLCSFDTQLHQLSTSKKMKISKVPAGFLKKAVTVFKIKTEVLHTKLLILASLRRRMALVRAVSRRIHALVSSSVDGARENKQAMRVEYNAGTDKALVLRKATAAASQDDEPAATANHHHERDGMIVDLSVVAMFDDEDDDHGYPDWTHSLFQDDDFCYNDDGDDAHDDARDGYGGVLDDAPVDDEPSSVIDIIRSNREVEGLEFNMDEEIDEACDMFIRRFRNRMNLSF